MLNLDIAKYFTDEIAEEINKYFEKDSDDKNKGIEEIRLRVDKPIQLKFNRFEKILNKQVSTEAILKTIQYACNNSIYSYQNQLCEGFITVRGGHRIGITGNCIIEDNKVTNINYISSLNFRIAKEIKGCSNKLLKYVLDMENNNIYTTLIVSPPGVRQNNYIKRFNKKNKHRNRKKRIFRNKCWISRRKRRIGSYI